MKKITRYALPRYVWFMLWFKAWFKHLDGIKGFATQVMNWLMQETLSLAKKLKKQNKKMEEAIRTKSAQLAKLRMYPTVDADEWDSIKGKVRKLAFWVFVGVATEAACNYFAIESVMEGKGWFWNAVRALAAVGLTGLCLYFFEKWFALVINKPAYKQVETKPRNWTELVILTFVCIGFEVLFYWLCKRRSVALIGAVQDDTITNFIIIFGMLLPIGAGYLAYERNRFVNAYRNTKRIAAAEKDIAKKENTIVGNNQRMDNHFKKALQDRWAILNEFKVYKENYNLKNGIETEYTSEHFCHTHDSFEQEATRRYNKQVLQQQEVLQPTLIIAPQQQNGHAKTLATHNY